MSIILSIAGFVEMYKNNDGSGYFIGACFAAIFVDSWITIGILEAL